MRTKLLVEFEDMVLGQEEDDQVKDSEEKNMDKSISIWEGVDLIKFKEHKAKRSYIL